jgi:fermentation-respiration switch protein FrsA (DUF1100 family)
MTLAAEDDGVAAVVSDSGFASATRALEDYFRVFMRLPAWPVPVVRRLARAVTGCDPGALDVLVTAPALNRRPILFIHGLSDNRISPDQTRALWAAAGSSHDLWLVPGAGHNRAWTVERRTYEDMVTRFFALHLTARLSRAGASPD